MFIYILDEIHRINQGCNVPPESWWLNLDNGEFFESEELQQAYHMQTLDEHELLRQGYLPFLTLPNGFHTIKRQFIESLNDKTLTKRFERMNDDDFERAFWHFVDGDSYHLTQEFNDFHKKELANLLIQWCDEHHIKWTLKRRKQNGY